MKKHTGVLIAFIALKFFLQFFLLSPEYELHRDEFLHLDQGSHLSWGYLSVPPFTSWTSWLIQLLGNGVFWVKFFPALYGAGTILVVWFTIRELGGNLFALVLGSTCVLFSALLRLNMLYQPNSFDVLCWASLYFVLVMYFKTDNRNWLYAGAVVFALGFFNKYNVVFQLLGLFPALLLTPQRKMFTRPALYIAAGIALMLISPNLWWQYQHGFPVFYHLQQLADTQLVNVDRLGFLKAQLLFYIGSVIVLTAALYSLLFYQPFRSFAFLFWSILFTLGVFIAFRAKDYYAIGIYPIYISFGAVYLESVCQEGWKRYLRPVLLVIPILLFVPVMNVAFPNKSPEYVISHADQYKRFGLLRWEDGQDHMLPQDFADMLGWKELARKVDSVYAVASKVGNTLVLCDNYGQTGAINFYTKQSIKAVSFNADYIYWFDLSKPYVNLIRVKWPEKIETELPETSPYFREGIIAETVTNPYARESGTKIYYFAGAKVDIRPRLQAEIDELSHFKF
ncbi:MAG: glycosyltransferase family 39 protein [Cyclobacteriaceae bacterium]|jgi:hypothetical protein|nr:glycosyltransferase family 39 protein [Cyclobacteriaceae bacterium]